MGDNRSEIRDDNGEGWKDGRGSGLGVLAFVSRPRQLAAFRVTRVKSTRMKNECHSQRS